MGIKDLNAFLKEHTPGAVTQPFILMNWPVKRLRLIQASSRKFMYKNERFPESFFNQHKSHKIRYLRHIILR